MFFNQLANVVEWEEFREDMVMWKWGNREIKRGSKLILKPGQAAVFFYNGQYEGIFSQEGTYDIESDIIPFLSTLKGFKFGFNSGMRAEVVFINTKELLVKWGTAQAVNIPTPNLPGGLPIRANGTFVFKVSDYMTFIDKISGVKSTFLVDDVRDRMKSEVSPLLMKWIAKEGKDLFNLQVNVTEISEGIRQDLDNELSQIGLSVERFNVMSFNYPEEVQNMVNKAASQSMVSDVNKYTQMAMADGMAKGNGSAAGDMMGVMMGMQMANNMMNGMNNNMNNNMGNSMNNNTNNAGGAVLNFCPNCGAKTNGMKFCGNCGQKLA